MVRAEIDNGHVVHVLFLNFFFNIIIITVAVFYGPFGPATKNRTYFVIVAKDEWKTGAGQSDLSLLHTFELLSSSSSSISSRSLQHLSPYSSFLTFLNHVPPLLCALFYPIRAENRENLSDWQRASWFNLIFTTVRRFSVRPSSASSVPSSSGCWWPA